MPACVSLEARCPRDVRRSVATPGETGYMCRSSPPQVLPGTAGWHRHDAALNTFSCRRADLQEAQAKRSDHATFELGSAERSS